MFSLYMTMLSFVLFIFLCISGLYVAERSYDEKENNLSNNYQSIQLNKEYKNSYNQNERETTVYNFSDLNNSIIILSLALVIIFLFLKSNNISNFISINKNKIKTKNILNKLNNSECNNLLNLIEEAEIQVLINNLIIEKNINPEIYALNLTLKNKINYLIENKFN